MKYFHIEVYEYLSLLLLIIYSINRLIRIPIIQKNTWNFMQGEDSSFLLDPVAFPLIGQSLDTQLDDPLCRPTLILLALGNRRVS